MADKPQRPIPKKIVTTVNGNNDHTLELVLEIIEKAWFIVKILISLFRKNPNNNDGDK